MKSNSSEILAQSLMKEVAGSDRFDWIQLPVAFNEAWEVLKKQILTSKPDFVLSLGQAEGRAYVGLEQFALNQVDARIEDNIGQKPYGKIRLDGPEALRNSLPLKAWILNFKGLPVEISYSAGTFVCNELYFKLLSAESDHQVQSLFVHLPLIQSEENLSFLALETQMDILKRLIDLIQKKDL